jgi:hypothetical protein
LIFSHASDGPHLYGAQSLPIQSSKDDCAIAGHLDRHVNHRNCTRCVLGSESDYLANARECEGRAQEMPPALRHTFVSLAAHWRKLEPRDIVFRQSRDVRQRGRGGIRQRDRPRPLPSISVLLARCAREISGRRPAPKLSLDALYLRSNSLKGRR